VQGADQETPRGGRVAIALGIINIVTCCDACLTSFQPEHFVSLGINPPKGVLMFGPPGTGKMLCARAVANQTDATFMCVIGSELVQKHVGEGARMICELFARSAQARLAQHGQHSGVHQAAHDTARDGAQISPWVPQVDAERDRGMRWNATAAPCLATQ
jgi:hypothetical protein